MKKLSSVLMALALALVCVAPAFATGPRQVNQGGAGQTLAGSYKVVLSQPGQPNSETLFTFTSDGTMLATTNASFGGNSREEQPAATEGHGAWVSTGGSSYAFTDYQLFLSPYGQLVGTLKLQGTFVLSADSNSGNVRFTLDVTSPSGKPLFSGSGTGVATRIQAMPTSMPGTGAGGTASADHSQPMGLPLGAASMGLLAASGYAALRLRIHAA